MKNIQSKTKVQLNELKKMIDENCMNRTLIAKNLGISKQAFANKLNGATLFRCDEAAKLITLLRMDNEQACRVFFCKGCR